MCPHVHILRQMGSSFESPPLLGYTKPIELVYRLFGGVKDVTGYDVTFFDRWVKLKRTRVCLRIVKRSLDVMSDFPLGTCASEIDHLNDLVRLSVPTVDFYTESRKNRRLDLSVFLCKPVFHGDFSLLKGQYERSNTKPAYGRRRPSHRSGASATRPESTPLGERYEARGRRNDHSGRHRQPACPRLLRAKHYPRRTADAGM